MHGFTIFVARYLVFVMLLALLYVLLKLRRREQLQLVAQAVLATILAFALAKLTTHLISSPRPFIADGVTPFFSAARDNGFPSDHTLMAGLIAFSVVLYSRQLGYVMVALAAAVGIARVLSGVHHTIDIIGGLALSGLSVLAVNLLYNRHFRRPADTISRHHD